MRHLLVLALLVTPGCASVASYGLDPTINVAASRAEHVDYNVRTVRMALEQYATDHGGNYPVAARLREQLCQEDYLPGNKFPQDPWNVPGTEMPVAALDVADDFELAKAPLKLPEVSFSRFPAALRRPGTLIYLYQQGSKTYTVYGVGEELGQIKLVAGFSNDGGFLLPGAP